MGFGSPQFDRAISAINFLAMPDAENQHDETVVFNFADQPVFANPVSPQLSEAGTLQSLPDVSRIVQLG